MTDYDTADNKILVLKDKSYRSKQVRSVYEQYVLMLEKAIPQEKKLFHAFLDLPELWEVRSDDRRGAVFNMGVKQATIYYQDPEQERIVERVEWIDKAGNPFRTDYYNCFGYVFSSSFFNSEGNLIFRAFYTSEHEEIINVNYSNGTVLLFENGKMKQVFHSEDEFEAFAFRFMAEQAQVLKRWKIGCQVKPKAEVLILTATDMVYGIEKLSALLPDVTFHIAAHTMMSPRLLNLEEKGNIRLYPGIAEEMLWKLYDSCSLYLDISGGREIYDAISTAILNGLPVMGFRSTLHQAGFVAEKCIFDVNEPEQLAEKIRIMLIDTEEKERVLEQQRKMVMR